MKKKQISKFTIKREVISNLSKNSQVGILGGYGTLSFINTDCPGEEQCELMGTSVVWPYENVCEIHTAPCAPTWDACLTQIPLGGFCVTAPFICQSFFQYYC